MSKKEKWIYGILVAGSVLAALKMLFWGYGLDEEYQIIMSYRNIKGDTMFGLMHESHQTSSFLCTFFMWLYRLITGGYTGVVIWLRFCGTLIHLLLSVFVYRVAKKDFKSDNAFLVALIYFNLVPKQMMIPEFANMQMWFFTLTVFCLVKYFLAGEKKRYLTGCGLALSLEVLAYPSMVLQLPFLLAVIWLVVERQKVRACVHVAGTCLASALLYVGYFVLRDGGISGLIATVGRIATWDGAHDGTTGGAKWLIILQNAGVYLLWTAAICAVAFLVNKVILKKEKELLFVSIADCAVLISCGVQLIFWVVLNRGYEYLHLHVAVMLVAGVIYYFCGKREKPERLLLLAGILGTVVSLLGICILTNLNLLVSMAHAGVGMVFAVLLRNSCIVHDEDDNRKKVFALLAVLCLTLIVGKGYTMRQSRDFSNVLESKARLLYGPAAGCITDFDTAQIYNRVYEMWETVDLQDANLLVVSESVNSPMNTWYMFDESFICHYSIINPSFYDERLLTYWEMFPTKAPDVIAVECSEGQPVPGADKWIMKYVTEEFDYTQIVESYFVRLYMR